MARATPPEPTEAGSDGAPAISSPGEAAHFRGLEALYASAPVNDLYPSTLAISSGGRSRIEAVLDGGHFHAAGAVHGTAYFKLLDDAAFYAANSLVPDRFLLTTGFNLFFTRPLAPGPVVAEGRWLSGRRRVYVAEARLISADGEEVGRGTGTFMRSKIALSSLDGYRSGAVPTA
jgi:acyl-coenzyme A thioesterase PaaI-like protein